MKTKMTNFKQSILLEIRSNLKRLLMIVLLCYSILPEKAFANGESCSNSYTVSPDETYQTHDYFVTNTDKSVWISFVANESSIQIYSYETATSPGTVANEMHAYNGSCASLTEINSAVFNYTKYGQRELLMDNLNIGETYFVKIMRN